MDIKVPHNVIWPLCLLCWKSHESSHVIVCYKTVQCFFSPFWEDDPCPYNWEFLHVNRLNWEKLYMTLILKTCIQWSMHWSIANLRWLITYWSHSRRKNGCKFIISWWIFINFFSKCKLGNCLSKLGKIYTILHWEYSRISAIKRAQKKHCRFCLKMSNF